MSIRPVIALFLIPFSARGQYDKLVNHKDIIWAAKVESAVSFEMPSGPVPAQLLEAIAVKAIQDEPAAPHPHPFTQTLNRLIGQGAFPAYTDRELQRPISHSEAMSLMVSSDTVVVFDPETYEEKIHIATNELLGKASVFITRQLWMYNGRTNELETVALAIAPAIDSKAPSGEYEPLVWFKLPPPQKKLFALKSRAVQFAAYLRYNVSAKDIEVLKGEEHSLQAILIEKLKSGELMGYDNQRQPIPGAQAGDVFIHQDTIITFDPETYEEHVQVVRMEFGPLDISDFRVQQNWFFAPGHKALQCSATAVGPAVPVIDEYGARLYLRPLFFWRRE